MSEGIDGLFALMDRYIDGDPRAFAALHDKLSPRLRGFVLRMVRDEASVDDLVQLTLLKAHLARERFVLQGGDPDGAVQAWYFAICRNVTMDFLRTRYRSESRRASSSPDGQDPVAALPDEGPDPEQLGQALDREDEIVEAVRNAVAQLPPGQREVVELHKQRGMSMAEIAERLSVREGAVRVRAHRAYKAQAKMLSRGQLDALPLLWLMSGAALAEWPDSGSGSGSGAAHGAAPDPDGAGRDAWIERCAAPPRRTAPPPPADASRTARASCRRP